MYSFIRVGGYYVSADQQLTALVKLLWTSAIPFGINMPLTRFGISLPGFLGRVLRIARIIITVSLRRRSIADAVPNVVLQSDYPGHIALTTYDGGCRVFDLEANRVRYILPKRLDDAGRQEFIGRRQQVARHPVAAKLLGASPAEGWIDEEYVNGRHPAPFPLNSDWVQRALIPLLGGMIQESPCPRASISQSSNELKTLIVDKTSALQSDLADRIRVTSVHIAESLSNWEKDEIFLTQSHGDIWERNMLCYQDRIIFLDWERYAERSAMFDLVFLLFHQLCWSPVDVAQPMRELDALFDAMASCLADSNPALATQLASAEHRLAYRRLAYLETIVASLNEPSKLDDKHLAGNTIVWMDAFCRVEGDYDVGFGRNLTT